ncbi:hypothetical protein CerSpe_156830 [Prunus speciosa]
MPSRGIRQGDPLYPYLFLFVSEALSCLIQKSVIINHLQCIKISNPGPVLSHLLFADDSLFFLKAFQLNCQKIMRLLHAYYTASGQSINFNKSNIYFGQNVPVVLKHNICNTFGMDAVTDPSKYLGLPTIWGIAKTEALAYIKERIKKKIGSWKHNMLSQAGQEVLIKAVA